MPATQTCARRWREAQDWGENTHRLGPGRPAPLGAATRLSAAQAAGGAVPGHKPGRARGRCGSLPVGASGEKATVPVAPPRAPKKAHCPRRSNSAEEERGRQYTRAHTPNGGTPGKAPVKTTNAHLGQLG